ncbi:hypothetical protein GIZ64_13735 [Salmonella enterica]|uniref:Uncharacterized protein n=2 Tax=Salmonella enterica TaxID=28901 RepID=A0A3F3IYC0_SALER|nr:hypothetical protein [Salmonella enterica]ECH6351938.1 hypothetical protein [Salmonella enterica subsp. enterica serovar Javiana]ECM0318210.1 hypothetical protein [Salmonella enterica subsp. enterica serovar Newport]ECT8159757.1 hypothetical protein [Salmonella enterica subsp. enterica serovar Typhimurium]ECY4665126.1 hypothetical protein [Salmonella enterica subsp. enterica serovar Manchester]EDH9864877.1 hypothetical protein [Salmonella enterica subsp. enterica serovar Enteritidis]EDR649
MSIGLFIQGPMEEKEAEELAERYRKAGRRVNVTPSFQAGLKLVQVYLPESKRRPKASRIYQQKIWR